MVSIPRPDLDDALDVLREADEVISAWLPLHEVRWYAYVDPEWRGGYVLCAHEGTGRVFLASHLTLEFRGVRHELDPRLRYVGVTRRFKPLPDGPP